MTLVAMLGARFFVLCPYRLFCRRWHRAMVGRWSRRVLIAFHRWFGVRLRPHPVFIEVACRDSDGRIRRRFLNPRQIAWAAEPEPTR